MALSSILVNGAVAETKISEFGTVLSGDAFVTMLFY